MILCLCGSGKEYKHCCKILHDGSMAQNALELMRSRYSAYAMNNAAYIIATTHPLNQQYDTNFKQWTKAISKFCGTTRFKKLEIIDFIDGDTEAYVTFTAHLESGGQDVSFTEKSRFEKVGGKWLYHSGEFRD